jgi:hypothetical protein
LVTIAKETGQAAAIVSSINIEKMIAALWAASFNNPNSVRIYNQGLLAQLSVLTTSRRRVRFGVEAMAAGANS